MKRAAFKLVFFVVAALAQVLAGQHFLETLTLLVSISAMLAILLGCWNREEVGAPHLTYFDEGIGFFALGCLLRAVQ